MIPIFFLTKGGYGLMAMVWTDSVSVVYKQSSPKKHSVSQGQRSTTLKSCFKCFQVLSTNNSRTKPTTYTFRSFLCTCTTLLQFFNFR